MIQASLINTCSTWIYAIMMDAANPSNLGFCKRHISIQRGTIPELYFTTVLSHQKGTVAGIRYFTKQYARQKLLERKHHDKYWCQRYQDQFMNNCQTHFLHLADV
jgi:hypothetical protein